MPLYNELCRALMFYYVCVGAWSYVQAKGCGNETEGDGGWRRQPTELSVRVRQFRQSTPVVHW